MELQIHDSTNGQFYWRIVSSNRVDVLARSELLVRKAYALSAAEQFKAYAQTSKYKFEVVPSGESRQPWRWHVIGNNYEKVVASTENYYNRYDAQATADSVKYNVHAATIVDMTRSA